MLLSTSCSAEKEQDNQITLECNINIDTLDFTFGIDYDNPELYLIPGTQSTLSDSFYAEVVAALGEPASTISGALQVCHWVNQNFEFENAGGAMIGVNTVDELFKIKKFYGCHSAALIISSILRRAGIPALMIETAGVQWAYDYAYGRVKYFSGHVMTEVYIADHWVLLDNNCTYIDEYDPSNPFIAMQSWNPDDYFVYAKGVDIWDYTKNDNTFTNRKMLDFTENVLCFEPLFHTDSYQWGN